MMKDYNYIKYLKFYWKSYKVLLELYKYEFNRIWSHIKKINNDYDKKNENLKIFKYLFFIKQINTNWSYKNMN